MFEFLSQLLDTSGFPPRWHCGSWSVAHGWLHILSDLGVWTAYLAIPCTMVFFLARRPDLPFRKVFLLFGAFILACGTTHLMEAILFWWPAYRVAGVIKFLTAIISWATAITLIPVLPMALKMRTPGELEREIMERRKAEQELRASEERLKLALYATNLGIFEHEHGTGVTYWSPVVRDILGWGADDPASLPDYIQLIHPADRNDRVATLQQAHHPAGDGVEIAEHRIVRPDGNVRWVRVCARTHFKGAEHARGPIRTIGTLADVTATKHAEEARARLAAIVDSAEDPIISKTLDGIFTTWNAGAERLLGYSAHEALGKHNSLIIPVERREEEAHYLARIISGETIEHQETVRLHKSGRRIDVALSLSPVRDSTGTIVGCAKIMHDITARKHLEKEVLEIATREQQRIGHELHDTTGQELTALSLLAEALAKKLSGRPPAEAVIAGKILKGLQRTLGQIRSIARGLAPVEIDSNGLLASLRELAARISESSGVNCTLHCDRNPVEVNNSQTATQLYHIAQEAATNALRHGRPSQITMTLSEDHETVTLRIQDDGAGPPKLEPENGGMGLKIMRYRAGLINGRLTFEPADLVGAVVTCTLFKGTVP